MSDFHDEYKQLVDEVRVLVKKHARGNPPRLSLSQDTVDILSALNPSDEVSEPATAAGGTLPPASEATPQAVQKPESNSPDENQQEQAVEAKPISADMNTLTSLEDIAQLILSCTKCALHETRTKAVPGEGASNARLVFVGEAPGASEDAQGRPFVGRSGNLLTDMIEKGMQIPRAEVFICNVVKCRPPENRVPSPDEVRICEPYLLRQLDLLQPQVICALGAVAAQTLLKTNDPIFKLRGVWHNYHNIPLRVTYHPAYLLRNPPDKKKAWEDLQEIMKLMKDNENAHPDA